MGGLAVVSDGGMRASDSDREKVVEVLGAAYTEGRLSLDEFDDRTNAAYAAKTWDQLRQLTGDLPSGVTPDGEPQPHQPDFSPMLPAGRTPQQHGVVFVPFLPVAIVFLILATSTHAVLLFVPMVILLFAWRASRPRRRSGGGPPPERFPDRRGDEI
jgi:hypothetical protein